MRISPAIPRVSLYVALAAWAGCTIARQIDPTFKNLKRLERSGVTIPNYRFFGPIPGVHDVHLLIRCHLDDGRTTPWRELILREDRRLIHMLWAPHRRVDKGVADALQDLLAVTKVTKDIRRLSGTIPYLGLLNLTVLGVEHPSDAKAAQFAIGRSAVFDASVPPQIVFASAVHEIEKVRAPQTRSTSIIFPESSVEA